MQVLPSKAAAKRESATRTFNKIGIEHGNARSRPAMTAKASPGSCLRQDKHSQQQGSCCVARGKEATVYRSMSRSMSMSRKGSQQTQRELSLEVLSCKALIHHGETGRVVQYRVLKKRKRKQISC